MDSAFPKFSIRAHLIALVALAVLPALVVIVYLTGERWKMQSSNAETSALRLAQLVAEQQDRLTESTRALLSVLGRAPEVRKRDIAAMRLMMVEVLKSSTYYLTLKLVEPSGHILATALPESPMPETVADRRYFQAALATKAFSAGEYTVSRSTGKPSLHFALPVLNEAGEIDSVVVAALNLEIYTDLMKAAGISPSWTVVLDDWKGRILYHSPNIDTAGQIEDSPDILQYLTSPLDRGTFRAYGVDGLDRHFAFTKLRLTPNSPPYLFVRVGIPVTESYGPVQQTFQRSMILLALAALLAGMSAWYLGDHIIGERVRSLAAAARRLGEGDLSVRVKGVPRDASELGLLSEAFDNMAQALERRAAEAKKAEEEKLRATRLESIGLLAGGIAHDFNNLLAAMTGTVSVLQRVMSADAREQSYLHNLDSALKRARDLTHQLLTFAKGGTPVKKVVEIGPIIEDAVKLAMLGSKHRCSIELAPNLWSAEVDEGQITQVVQNLLLNAGQAMRESGVITVKAENIMVEGGGKLPLSFGPYVRLTVSDLGEGIPQEHLAHIFEPFFTTRALGHGLGLATVYSIVKSHQGYVQVESEPGRGATFNVYLPAFPHAGSRPQSQPEQVKLPALKILVMDDEPLVREALSEMLKLMGHGVCSCEDGESVLREYEQARLRGEAFDVVILDLTIPGGESGEQVLKQLKAIDPAVKAIASSGYTTDRVMTEYVRWGFVDCLPKPYRLIDLQQVLIKAVSARQNLSQAAASQA